MSTHGQPAGGQPPPQPRLLLYVAEGARAAAVPESRLQTPPAPVSQQHYLPHQHFQSTHKTYLKNPPADIEEPPSVRVPYSNQGNCDSAKQLVPEYANVETFQSRVTPNLSEIYQTRYASLGLDSHVQPLIVQQNSYSENSVNNSDKETNPNKNYMNYQCLEQNISHQSVVNQNISVINPVSGRSVCDSERQLVQTGDGIVVAVVPSPLTQESRTKQGDLVQTIIVPLGWKRIAGVSTVVYVSPSGTALSCLSKVREYLQTSGTCKCGLPCPLRPEATFSFDPKVVSKPYQPPTGSELTKLCNHKRKLLATLSSRAQSPATPPPNGDHMKVMGEVAILKKKMKKPGYVAATAPQHLMQRDQQRPQADYSKMQELDGKRITSPGLRMTGAVPMAVGNAPEKQSRVSHYLTVNSGWIQQDAEYKQCPNLNVGLPVLGANGQIIGVNTAFNKQVSVKNTQQFEQHQDGKRDSQPPRPKEDEGQIFCGLNQPLTPEVMQKINEQQQLFIQQNQKQIEIAMKGYRAQLETNQNTCQNQFASGQLVIQNGNVVKANPAKTPPWQVKRTDSITSPSSRSQKSDNMDFDDSSTYISEDSTASIASCNSSETLNQGLCSRVPPLPQQYNVIGQQWPVAEPQKKKTKSNKVTKKKGSPESKLFGANGMRTLNDPKINFYDDMPTNNIPSFMDDPTGYLAQQTALLNNTISRQVGLTSCDNQIDGNSFNSQGDKARTKSNYQMSYKSSTASNPSQSPNNTPDSSVLSDKGPETPSSCCRGCNVDAAKSHFENQPRKTYSKHNIQKKDDGTASSSAISREESSVTSSTFSDPGEACPIQAGTVSTSNERLDSTHRVEGPVPPPAVMHFISHHNINKNLMEVDNIAMVGVRPMPGYCPPPHLGGGPAHLLAQANYAQALVTTMASGFSVTRDTVTSVLAGRAGTATTSVTVSRPERLPPSPAAAAAAAYAIPNNHPDPFVHSVNLPTSYPLHIAGTTAQNMISKSPLEMVQNVLSSPTKSEGVSFPVLGRPASTGVNAGQILISSTGQMMLSNRPMPPPPPKVCQQQMMAPYVMQQSPSMESQTLQHSGPLPQLVAGTIDSRQMDSKTVFPCLQPVNISPESLKKKSKKKKTHANITNVLQITAPSNNIVLQSPQHSGNPQFSPRGFQLSPNNSLSPGAMLQALTIVPGKPGTPAHIVMNGQGGSSNFGSQSLLANTSPSQSINLLQPVNLINNGSGVVPNYPAFQQFIVPNLGGVVMTADGTAILQENGSGVPMQLQLQTVNGQNVLTPVQGGGVFAPNGNSGGVLLRTQNQQGKIIQSQHSPGAQFLSPNSQVMMSSPNFNGQLSPLLASLSPPTVTFNTSPHQVRSSNVQGAEFIQANQMSHLMVPLSPKQVSMSPVSSHRSNSTFVQNTTIVQQQTIMSNNSIQSGVASRLSFEPNMVVNAVQKQMLNQARGREMMLPSGCQMENARVIKSDFKMDSSDLGRIMNEEGEARSVSTQTLKAAGATSPPDTTTHSPPARHPDTTTRDEPDHAEAMVQCVSSSEQDMADAQGHSAWNYEQQSMHDSDAQGSMSNIHMMRQLRHNSVESTNLPYNHPMTHNHSHQDLTQIPNNYYDRGQMYKRKCEYEPASYRHEKIIRTSYSANGTNKMMEYEFGSDKQKMFSNSGPSSDGSGGQRVFDKHLGSDSVTKPEYQETRTTEEETHGELSSSEKGRCFEVGDLIWGPVKGYVSWPGKLVRKGEEGKWHVKWFGDKPPGMVDGSKLLTLSEGLEAHHTARTKHRKSRKLNTHLENAIQQAMAELDKKCDDEASTSTELTDEPSTSCTDTPRRKKNKDKRQTKVKTSSSPDHSRLRSAR